MKKNMPGTALLIVFFVLTIITIWATNVWRETAYMLDLAHTKQQYEQQFRLTEGLLEYGKCAAHILYQRWSKDSSKSAQTKCTFDHWPPLQLNEQPDKDYSGTIHITRNEQQVSIHAQLSKKQSVVCGLRCTMNAQEDAEHKAHPDKEPTFIVQEWAIDVS